MFATKKQFFKEAGGYEISKSLRFRASATAYLNRTCGVPTSSQKWTCSNWVKRGSLGAATMLYAQITNSNNSELIQFNSSDQLEIWSFTYTSPGNTYYVRLVSTQVFRDPSAWYHIVVNTDTTQATASNRVRAYVNGIEITSWSTATYPTQNYNWKNINTSTIVNYYGVYGLSGQYFDGYLAEWNFVDGQQLAPTSFGSFGENGVWSPTAYSGTYGNNGFYLKFTDNSALTTASNVGLGKDFSGNANYWVTNNISITAGTTYDSMIDSPTNAASETQPVGNYCVLNPLNASIAPTQANLAILGSSASFLGSRGTIAVPKTGKWYAEATAVNSSANLLAVCIIPMGAPNNANHNSANVYTYMSDGTIRYGGVDETAVSTWTTGDIISIAVSEGVVTMYKNNVSVKVWSQNLSTISDNYALGGFAYTAYTLAYNFGQRPFTYTPPSEHQTICTANLATPTIKAGAQYMAATTYTGTGATQSISNAVNGVSFQPDFVWVKNRSTATSQDNKLTDSVRGVTKGLISNTTGTETTDANGVTAFNSNGFSLGTGTRSYNDSSGDSYVAWQWKGGGTTTNITAGQYSTSPTNVPSVASTVSVNTTAGFSVVTYTGTGANATVGHGLGVAPSMIILKPRNAADNWPVWHSSFAVNEYVYLNLTNAKTSLSTFMNGTLPNSTVISLGTWANINTDTQTMVAYCFAPITGFSAFGSYTGNGSADGPFVYLGFRPRFIMWKALTEVSAGYTSWGIIDTATMTYNASGLGTQLWANKSVGQGYRGNGTSADTDPGNIDILSNGFKFRTSYVEDNNSSSSYIYAAFAEHPFAIARAR